MVTLRNFKIASFGLFLLTQCNNKDDRSNQTKFSSTGAMTQPKNPLIGEWKYNNTIWYSSVLTLQDNGSFTFHDQGCYGQRFSIGKWTKTNGVVFLTSFDDFNQKEPTKTSQVTEQDKLNRKQKKGEVEYSFVGFKKIPAPSLPVPDDTLRVYLNNIQLLLQNDTLYCVGENKLPEGAKFYRRINNR